MGLPIILFLGGVVILGWLYLWTRQRQRLGPLAQAEQYLHEVAAVSVDDAVLVSREYGDLVYINARARDWLELEGGQPDLEYIARMAQPVDSFLQLFASEGQSSFQIGQRWVEASSHRIPAGDEMRTVVVLRELGAGTQHADALDLTQAMMLINQMGEVINASLSMEQVLQALLAIIQGAIPADAGEITLWDEAERRLWPRGWVGDATYVLALSEIGGSYQVDQGITGWIARHRKPVLVNDLTSRTAISPMLATSPYKSFIGVPLQLGDRFIGTFELAAVEPGFFQQKDVALLQAISKQAAIAIYNAELYAEQTRRIDDIANLQAAIDQPDTPQYVRAVYAALNARLARLVGADMCGVLLYNEARGALLPELPFHGVPDQITREYSIPVLPGSPQREIWENQQYWISNDVADEPLVEALGLMPLVNATGLYNTTLIPLMLGGDRIGLIQLSNKDAEGGFTLRDIQSLRILATQAAVVVENVRLYQNQQVRETELMGLQEITQLIGAFDREDEFFAQMNQRIAAMMQTAVCGILHFDPDTRTLLARAPFHGLDEAQMRATGAIELRAGTRLDAIWDELDVWYTNRAGADRVIIEAEMEPFIEAAGIRQMMIAALVVCERRLGALIVCNRLDGEEFTPDDARLLMIFAAQAAAMIENTRLYRETRRRADESDSLRTIAEMAGTIMTPEDSFLPVLAEIARVTQSPVAFINALDLHGTHLVTQPRLVYGVELGESLTQNAGVPGFERAAAVGGGPFLSNDLAAEADPIPVYSALAERADIESAVIVPLLVGERPLGELGVANRGGYRDDDQRLLTAIAAQMAWALDRVLLYQSTGANLDRRIDELDAIARVSNELTLTLDLARIIEVIRQEAVRATGATGGTVLLLSKPNTEVVSRRVGADWPGLAEIERAAIQRAADSVMVRDYAESSLSQLPAEAGSALAAAFLYADEVVGVIHVYHTEPAMFDERAAGFLATLAAKAALGYGNAIRFEEQVERSQQLRRRLDQLNQIFELGQLLHTSTDLLTILEAISYSIQHSVGFDIVMMLLYEDGTESLRLAAQAGLPLDVAGRNRNAPLARAALDGMMDGEFRISESFFLPVEEYARWAGDHDLSMLETQFDGRRIIPMVDETSWRAGDLLILPLWSSSRVLVGVIALDNPHDNIRPTRATVELLEIFAHHASTTIENTRLYLTSIASAEQEALLNEVMEAVTGTLDIEEVVRAMANGAQRLLPAMNLTVALADEGLFDLYRVAVAMDGALTVTTERAVDLTDTALAYTFAEGRDALYAADAPESDRFSDLKRWHMDNERTSLIVPLMAGGEHLGALHIGSDLAQAYGFNEHRSMIRRLADLGAVAIQNARLFRQALDLRAFNESVLQSIQQGIIVLDRARRIITLNDFMRKSHGWGAESLGKDFYAHSPALAGLLAEDIEQVLATGEPQERIGQRLIEEAGAVVRNFYTYALGDPASPRGVVVMIDDVTDRAQLEKDLEARANQLTALTEVSSRITASLDHSEVVALALGEMRRIIAFDTMTFWLRDGDLLMLEGAKDYQDDTTPVGVRVRFANNERLRIVIEEQRVYTINRLQGWDRLPGEGGTQSWMGVPLVNQGEVVGVITLTKVEPSYYDSMAEQAAFAFANQVAAALANANLFREAERRTQRLSLLNRVSVALVQSLDSEDILEIALREIAQLLNIDRSRALMFERDLQVGRVVVEHPRGDTPPDQVIDLRQSATYQYIRRAVKALVIHDMDTFAQEQKDLADIVRELGPRAVTAYVIIPMAIGGQVIGAFEFEVYDGAHRFDHELIDLGRIISNQAAIAIQNTSLLEQTLVRTRELETLLEAAQATTVTLDLHEVFRSVVDLMMHALDMDDCALMMWNDVERTVEVVVDANRRGDQERITSPGTRYNLNHYQAKRRALEEHEILVIDQQSGQRFPEELADLEAAGDTARMIVPLIIRDQAIGLIQMEMQSAYRTFSHREVRLAQALASQAATAIENARLSTETANRVEELYIINDLSQAISSTLRLDDMIAIVRDRLPSVTDVEEMYLALYDADTEMISFPLAVHRGESLDIPARPLNDDEVSFIIRNRRMLTMGSDYFSPDELRRSLGIRKGEGDVKSYLGVPLISGDAVVGVLALRDSQRTRAFGVNSQGILATIGTQLGAAIQNARLIEKLSALNRDLEQAVVNRTAELQDERDRINTLYRITSELARTLDLERVLRRSLEMVAGAIHARHGVILQIDPATDRFHSRAVLRAGSLVEDAGADHPAEALAGWLIQDYQQRAVVIDDLINFPHWDASAPGAPNWRSALAVLLEINDDIQGIMILFSERQGVFGEDQMKLVMAAANQVAAAINNSDLYYLIRDQAERLGMLLRAEQEEAEKGSAILEGIADGVMLADADGKIIRFNSAAERILKLHREDVIGQRLSHLMGLQGGSAAIWARRIDEWVREPGAYRPGDFLAERLEMGERTVSVHLSPVYLMEDDQFLGTVMVFRDITKEVEVDRMKSEFISNVSHELRTPMTSIKGYADLLMLGAAGEITEQQRRFLDTIKDNADRLSALVNDLLNISRIDSGNDALDLSRVDVRTVIDGVVNTLAGKAQHTDKALEVTVNIPADLPTIHADAAKITQIFTNLVDNAFNYTYAGGKVMIDAARAGDEDILVRVRDTGIGIPEAFRDRVWERFERNDEHALVLDVAGTGLGLPIVKTLVEMHGGRVWFESEMGVGTTFFVRLPVDAFAGGE